MRVTFILPVYNGAATLPGCLTHLLAQSLRDWECIIVNDASPDNSMEILESYARQDSRIKIIRHERNGGVAAARNTGLRHARGEYVHFLDQDDHLFPESIQQLLHFFQQHSQAAGVHGDYVVVDARNEVILSHVGTPSRIDFGDIASFRGLIPFCALMPREAILKVGGLQMGVEGCDDWDLFGKLTRSGRDFQHSSLLVGQWRLHGRNNSRNAERMLENGFKVIEKLFAKDDRVPHPDSRWINGAPPELRASTSTQFLLYLLPPLIACGSLDRAVQLVVKYTELVGGNYLSPAFIESLCFTLPLEAGLMGLDSHDYFLHFEMALVSFLSKLEQVLPAPGLADAGLLALRNRYIRNLVAENRELSSALNRYRTSRSYRIGHFIVQLLAPLRAIGRLINSRRFHYLSRK